MNPIRTLMLALLVAIAAPMAGCSLLAGAAIGAGAVYLAEN